MYEKLTDRELLVSYNNGDEVAFKELYDRYWGVLFKHAQRMLKDNELASDAVQDAFMKLLEKCDSFNQDKSIPGFLYNTMRNKILNLFTHEKVKETYNRYLHSYHASEFNFTEDEVFSKREDLELELITRIEKEISNLPPQMRQAFEMAKLLQLSLKQIASQTGKSENTIKKQVHVAMQIIRSKLLFMF